MSDGGKGSKRRPKGLVTDEGLLKNWERIFGTKPNDKQFNKEEDEQPTTKPQGTTNSKTNVSKTQRQRVRKLGRNSR